MNKQDNRSYLNDILGCSRKIVTITEKMSIEEFEKDLVSPLAVARLFEIIGEATKNLSKDLRDQYPDIPWKKMAGMRDILIHQYQEANDRMIFNISKKEIPELIVKIEKIYTQLQSLE